MSGNAGIVESHVQTAVSGDCSLNHRRNLSIVSDIADNCCGLVSGSNQLFGFKVELSFIDVCKDNGCTRLGESFCCG
ncbi:hypothetical protein D3C87_1828790 [compost metagenome]